MHVCDEFQRRGVNYKQFSNDSDGFGNYRIVARIACVKLCVTELFRDALQPAQLVADIIDKHLLYTQIGYSGLLVYSTMLYVRFRLAADRNGIRRNQPWTRAPKKRIHLWALTK